MTGIDYNAFPKITLAQRKEIVAIALLQRGPYSAYPVHYIAALYGVSHVYVCKLVHQSGKYRKSKFHATLCVARMGIRNYEGART